MGQVDRGVGQALNRENNIFDDDRGSAGPDCPHRGKQPLADIPQAFLLDGVGREMSVAKEVETGNSRLSLVCILSDRRQVSSLKFDQQTCGASWELPNLCWNPRLVFDRSQRRPIHKFKRRCTRLTQRRNRIARSV